MKPLPPPLSFEYACLLLDSSLVCAIAPTSNALIIGRAIAGAGVGGLFTGSILVVIYSSKSFFAWEYDLARKIYKISKPVLHLSRSEWNILN